MSYYFCILHSHAGDDCPVHKDFKHLYRKHVHGETNWFYECGQSNPLNCSICSWDVVNGDLYFNGIRRRREIKIANQNEGWGKQWYSKK